MQRHLQTPLTCPEIAALRKRVIAKKGEESTPAKPNKRPSRLASSIESAFARDAAKAKAELEALLRPLGFRLVSVQGAEPRALG